MEHSLTFCAKNIQIMFYDCIDIYIFNVMLLISNNKSEIRFTDCEFLTRFIFFFLYYQYCVSLLIIFDDLFCINQLWCSISAFNLLLAVICPLFIALHMLVCHINKNQVYVLQKSNIYIYMDHMSVCVWIYSSATSVWDGRAQQGQISNLPPCTLLKHFH